LLENENQNFSIVNEETMFIESNEHDEVSKFSNWCTSFIFKNNKSKYTLVSNLDLWFDPSSGSLVYMANYFSEGVLISKNSENFATYGSTRAISLRGRFALAINKRNTKLNGKKGLQLFIYELIRNKNRVQVSTLL